MKRFQITYYTEDPSKEYVLALRKVKTAKELIAILEYYKPLNPKGLQQAKKMTDKDVVDMHRDWKKASKPGLSEKWVDTFVKRFGEVLVPDRLLQTALVAEKFKAPWGTAYIRLKETGKFKNSESTKKSKA